MNYALASVHITWCFILLATLVLLTCCCCDAAKCPSLFSDDIVNKAGHHHPSSHHRQPWASWLQLYPISITETTRKSLPSTINSDKSVNRLLASVEDKAIQSTTTKSEDETPSTRLVASVYSKAAKFEEEEKYDGGEEEDDRNKKKDGLVAIFLSRLGAAKNNVTRSIQKFFFYFCQRWGWSMPRRSWITHFSLWKQTISRAAYFSWHAIPMILHYKWTQRWLQIVAAKDEKKKDAVYERLHNQYAAQVLKLLLRLKGMYFKMGQTLSTLSFSKGCIPPQYIQQLSKLQQTSGAGIPQLLPVERIQSILQESWRKHLGIESEDVLESIDPVALGTSSIGQVHAAALNDEWAEKLFLKRLVVASSKGEGDHAYWSENVAIKVMYPNVRTLFLHDFRVIKCFCFILGIPQSYVIMLHEMMHEIMQELDYQREVCDINEIRENILHSKYANICVVPEPKQELCCPDVLCMEWLEDGIHLSDALAENLTRVFGSGKKVECFLTKFFQQQPFQQNDDSEVGNRFWRYLKDASTRGLPELKRFGNLQRKYAADILRLLLGIQGYHVFMNGCYSVDLLDPSNCLLLPDGRLGLVNFGNVQRLTDEERLRAARLICALAAEENSTVIAQHMRSYGFQTQNNTGNKDNDDAILAEYAQVFLDHDYQGSFDSPTLYFTSLMRRHPLGRIPESSKFITRSSFLLQVIKTVVRMPPVWAALEWEGYAKRVVEEMEGSKNATVQKE